VRSLERSACICWINAATVGVVFASDAIVSASASRAACMAKFNTSAAALASIAARSLRRRPLRHRSPFGRRGSVRMLRKRRESNRPTVPVNRARQQAPHAWPLHNHRRPMRRDSDLPIGETPTSTRRDGWTFCTSAAPFQPLCETVLARSAELALPRWFVPYHPWSRQYAIHTCCCRHSAESRLRDAHGIR